MVLKLSEANFVCMYKKFIFLNHVHGKVSIFYICYTVVTYICVLHFRNESTYIASGSEESDY